jgi:hypothetical protein
MSELPITLINIEGYTKPLFSKTKLAEGKRRVMDMDMRTGIDMEIGTDSDLDMDMGKDVADIDIEDIDGHGQAHHCLFHGIVVWRKPYFYSS